MLPTELKEELASLEMSLAIANCDMPEPDDMVVDGTGGEALVAAAPRGGWAADALHNLERLLANEQWGRSTGDCVKFVDTGINLVALQALDAAQLVTCDEDEFGDLAVALAPMILNFSEHVLCLLLTHWQS